MDRAGIVGADGPTHHGLVDIAYLRGYPNIVLMAPKDEGELRDMMLTAIEHPGPAALRYPRGNGFGVDISSPPQRIVIGKAEVLQEGSDVAMLAYGEMVYPSIHAAELLAKDGINATVVNARFVKPLDERLITELANSHRLMITAEDAYLAGGFGSAVLELLEAKGLADKVRVVRVGVSDEIVSHGDPKVLLARYGLSPEGIADKVRETLDSMESTRLDSQRIRAVK
jgi:1-deoxy-D-xylulose-5-phosphate synthase